MKLKNNWLPLIPAVFAVSWAAILIRACDAPATIIAFYRMIFAAVMLLPFVLTVYRRNFREFTKYSLLITSLAGVLLGWHFFFWIESLNHTSIASSVVLVTTQPVYVAILASLILKEKTGLKGIISIILAIIGTILIAGFDFSLEKEYLWGDMLALAGAVMAGCYLFIGRIVRPRLSTMPYIFTAYSMAALTLGIIVMVKGEFGASYQSSNYWYFFLLAAGPTLVGHTLYNYTLRHVKAHKVGLSIVGEPILASIWAIFIFSEYPTIGAIIGGVIIIFSLVLVFSERGQ
ncbi:MAG: DMT family transporter [candidate division Zixibacteria bacterium]|nr:DMT family transporter [candidate division Zixibacteria bacterium]